MAWREISLGFILSYICSILNVEAGKTGLFLEPGIKCPRNPRYTRTTYGCYGYSMEPVTWEFARDACRDDGGHLAIFDSIDDYKTTQMRMPSVMFNASDLSYVGLNEDGDLNITAEPESVPYGRLKTYDAYPSLLTDGDANRPSYRCGVLTHANWSGYATKPSNTVVDPKTGITYPYAPSPYMYYCPVNNNDSPLQPYVCRLPGPPDGSTCVCTKWKEPGVRNFQGDYFSLPDQTEYIMVDNKPSYQINILLWKNSPPSFPHNDTYIPDYGAPVDVVRVLFGGKTYDMTTRNGSIVMLVNGVVAASLNTLYTITGLSVRTVQSTAGWKAMMLGLQGTRIIYDGKNMEIMSVGGVAYKLHRGLCGSCRINASGHYLPNGRLTWRKTLLASAWISPRVRWISEPPAVETCPSETAKRFAANRCRPLFDTTGYFGSCLTTLMEVAIKSQAMYRDCLDAVCAGGPAAACSFFLKLNNWCGNSAKDYSVKLECSDNSSCPTNKNYILSDSGTCYHVAENETYWDQAYRYCHSIGSQLVSLKDEDENEFLRCKIANELMQNITDPEKQFLWIGGIVDDHKQRHWTDGTSMSYWNWDPDQETATDPTVRCGTYSLDGGKWLAKSCKNDTFRALCYVYAITNNTCSGLPCPPPKVCVDGMCILAPMKVNNCDPNPCRNGGQCFTEGYIGGGFLCVCVDGFFSSRCERNKKGTSTKLLPQSDAFMINRLAQPPERRSPPSACWTRGNQSDYLLSSDKLAWELAREKCRGYGGRLNSLDLVEDKQALDQAFQPVYTAYIKRANPLAYLRDGYEYKPPSTVDCKMWGNDGR